MYKKDETNYETMDDLDLFNNCYRNKKVIITGNTGFKGSWLTAWLLELGAKVYGISNGIPTKPSHFIEGKLGKYIGYVEVDIRDAEKLDREINKIEPDYLFHLAAQAIVKVSYLEPLNTINTNTMGTLHVLEALRSLNRRCIAVIITSDKCYENVEWAWGYREIDSLGGKDPYSASKGAAEMVIRTYAESFFEDMNSPVKIASARAGNVVGGGDWAQDRIVPDCMRAWSTGKAVELRNPRATRPWQHVLEPLSGYLTLGVKLSEKPILNGEAFNFGPTADQDYSVGELIEAMNQRWECAKWEDISEDCMKVYESSLLKLCCDKASAVLKWKPTLDFEETIRLTVDWYRNFYEYPQEDIFKFTKRQIGEYVTLAQERGAEWTKS